jgi:hypothetical protein
MAERRIRHPVTPCPHRPTDEAIGNDLQWHPTDYLERYYVLGSMDRENVEITAAEAEALLERWRAEARNG